MNERSSGCICILQPAPRPNWNSFFFFEITVENESVYLLLNLNTSQLVLTKVVSKLFIEKLKNIFGRLIPVPVVL